MIISITRSTLVIITETAGGEFPSPTLVFHQSQVCFLGYPHSLSSPFLSLASKSCRPGVMRTSSP